MGGLRDFLIKFDKPQPVYFPGDVVSGQLVVNLSEQKNFKKIKVELVGKGKVFWQETRSDSNGTRTDTFNNSEEYVEHEVVVHQGRVLNTSLLYETLSQWTAAWSTLFGRGMTRLVSQWSRAYPVMHAPAVLCHKERVLHGIRLLA